MVKKRWPASKHFTILYHILSSPSHLLRDSHFMANKCKFYDRFTTYTHHCTTSFDFISFVSLIFWVV